MLKSTNLENLAYMSDYILRDIILKFDDKEDISRFNKQQLITKIVEISETKKELDTIEERYATGKIDTLIYNKFSVKCKQEITELEEKLMNPNLTSSNLQKCIKNGFDLSKNLSKIWTSGDLFDKHKLQHFLFPNGFAYDKQNGRVQTFRTNVFFELIRSISMALSEINRIIS